MPPQIAERCDLAIWEMEPGLLGAFCDRLGKTRTVRGPLVDLMKGHLHERQIVVATLKTNKLSEALQAVASAHGPRQTLLVGPASAAVENLAPGVLLQATRIDRKDNETLSLSPIELTDQQNHPRCGVCGDGPIDPSEQTEVLATSRWAYDAGRAAERSGVAVMIALAIVTPRPSVLGAKEIIQPPEFENRSFVRRTGEIVGALWRRPKSLGALWKKQSARWEQGDQFADALEELVKRLP